MNTYQQSNGEPISKAKLDRKIAQAKDKYSRKFEEEYGYIFCERHESNECKHIARSHIISVKECQNSGRAELAYDLDNLEHLCGKAHMEFESLPNEKREAWFHARQHGLSYDAFINNYED